jgi:hypothetical protein
MAPNATLSVGFSLLIVGRIRHLERDDRSSQRDRARPEVSCTGVWPGQSAVLAAARLAAPLRICS